MERIYIFKRFERFWHWSQAALIIALMLTGFEVHGSYSLFGFADAVTYHTIAAWTLNTNWTVGWGTLALINAGLAQGKHRSGLNWFALSVFLGPIATLILVVLDDPTERWEDEYYDNEYFTKKEYDDDENWELVIHRDLRGKRGEHVLP